MNTKDTIKAIPTNIITGFLGVGKTSAILNLLKQKPSEERWAILINEFGEIGIDGNLLKGQSQHDTGIYISEVPGGCMCCTAGLPMQIALNRLLKESRPDRLIIEPTGLGHPREMLGVLLSKNYENVLSINKTITLVDARKIKDEQYIKNKTFNQQIEIADLIVANKQDLYETEDKVNLACYIEKSKKINIPIIFTKNGELSLSNLNGIYKNIDLIDIPHKHLHDHQGETNNINETKIPTEGYLKTENIGEGYKTVGWRFCPTKTFCRNNLQAWLNSLKVERLKAVFITSEGIFGYNITSDIFTEINLEDCLESRIEIISKTISNDWESQILACQVK